MTVNLSALAGAGQQFFDNSGNPLTGGKLYSYAAGTTTPQAAYTSASGATPLSNPIILDSAGRIATGEIWITAGSNYKFVLKTSTDTTLATWDNITGINGTGITSNASSVTYDPAGTGAVSTTVQAKLREFVSVKDFGALGDGTTNDTAAIQAAIDSGKGGIYFPEGKYRVTSQITLTSDLLIFGAGKRKSIIAADFSTVGIYMLYGLNESNLTFRDMSLWGYLTENAGTVKAFASAYVSGCSEVLFDNCEFSTCTTHTLTLTRDFAASWIQSGNPNSQASVDALTATSCQNVRVKNCSFRYAGSNHFAAFGVNGLWLESTDFSDNVNFYDILIDGASTGTVIQNYAVNANVNVLNNIGTNSMLIVDTSSANLEGNINDTVFLYSYDFDQQIANLATPFFHQNYAYRNIRISNNRLNKISLKSYGYVIVENNTIQSSANTQTLVQVDNNAILWGGGITYYDSITTTAVDTEFVNTVIRDNTFVAAHTGITGITGTDFYRVTEDNVFAVKSSGAYTATDVVGASNAAASSLVNTTNQKIKRKSRFVNEVLDSGTVTITVPSGSKTANTTISFNYGGVALGTAPLIFATIQNMNNVIIAGEEPATVGAYTVTVSGASLAVWLAANAGADRAVSVAWVVVAQ